MTDHHVALVVPYRDLHPAQQRSAHLARFLPHITTFLASLPVSASVHVVAQNDDGKKFNRGKLLNAGFDLVSSTVGGDRTSFIFHDVDLLPAAALAETYAQFPTAPHHIGACWGRYNKNPKFFGGVTAFRAADFVAANGFPNTFWGWGGEDDELRARVEDAGLKIDSCRGADHFVDLEGMTAHTKVAFLKADGRDWKCNVKWELLAEHAETWRANGWAAFARPQYDLMARSTDTRGPVPVHRYEVWLRPNGHWSDAHAARHGAAQPRPRGAASR